METLLNRFLRYVKIDTQSNEKTLSHPSSAGQMELAHLLQKELQDIGLSNIRLTDKGYLMAELPANTDMILPAVGFIAHLDTSPDVSGQNVNPLVFENYDGQDIVLNESKGMVLQTEEFPELKDYTGNTLITSDGNTLLGADDKAGIAAIMTAMDHIIKNDLPHGKIAVAFTPDEEIGQGADFFDVNQFGTDFAYTVDGGPIGELEYETFNAALASINIQGTNVHPGTAYLRMQNALLLAMELNAMLPVKERPEYTQEYEGFYHLTRLEGTVEAADVVYIIRDHDRAKFENKKTYLQNCVQFLNQKYANNINLNVKDQYYNMREKIEPCLGIVNLAEKAMLENGITPVIKPIRGGTDGARLSYMGLPCPNIFTGGHNFHSRYEFISLESMLAASQVIVSIVRMVEARDIIL